MPSPSQNTTQKFSRTIVLAINCHINYHEHQGRLLESLKQTPWKCLQKTSMVYLFDVKQVNAINYNLKSIGLVKITLQQKNLLDPTSNK
jgi:hypothetical protein